MDEEIFPKTRWTFAVTLRFLSGGFSFERDQHGRVQHRVPLNVASRVLAIGLFMRWSGSSTFIHIVCQSDPERFSP